MLEKLTVTIEDLAFGGDGIARAPDGRVLFIPFTIPGEEVEVEITTVHQRRAVAEVRAINTPSPHRTIPQCPHFGSCGGCQYQHLDYAQQVEWKCKQLNDLLKRVGKLPVIPELSGITASPASYAYRNKLTLEPFITQDGSVSYGFCQRDNESFFQVDHCPLAMPGINALIPAARQAALTSLPSTQHAGRRPPNIIFRQPSRGPAGFHIGRPHPRIDWLAEELLGKSVQVPPASFWQINPPVADSLVQTVTDWIANAHVQCLIDAYAGAGTFSLAAGKSVKSAVLIETDKIAMAAARWNHQHLGLENREFVTGRTEQALPRYLAQKSMTGKSTLVLLDPPRDGCDSSVTRALCQQPVKSIIYVSCNAATLARDLKRLCVQGPYRLEKLTFADMFPQTAHFESSALMIAE